MKAGRFSLPLALACSVGVACLVLAVVNGPGRERAPRSATAIAEEPSQLLGLDQEVLFELMADHAAIIPGIVEVIARRRARG